MIAKNYISHVEALRFQREMFFKGYKNQPRIMRLMECIFNQKPSAPNWYTAAKTKARALAKTVEKAILPMFDGKGNVTWTFKKITSLDEVEFISRGELSRVKRTGLCSLEKLADQTPQELMMKGRMLFERAIQILERLRAMI